MIQTVIFDMDGVIVDTEPIHHEAFMKHFEEIGIDVSQTYYRTLTGLATRNVYENLKGDFGCHGEVEALVRRKRDIFNERFDTSDKLALIEGVEDCIKELFDKGIQLILASSSSKETIARVFERFALHSYFTHIVSGEDFPQSKPHPAIFEKAVELSGSDRCQCIVIEDSTNGILAAKAAQIYCVAYNSLHSKDQKIELADQVINYFSELDINKLNYLKEVE